MINGEPNFLSNTIRLIFSAIDSICYWLLNCIYEIFFTVSTAKIFSGDVINVFYSRIQLIIGIYMIFKLSFSVLGYITNPDKVTDKQRGIGNIITRIMIAMVMLTLIIPINNIPDSQATEGSLNAQIKYHGVLFGFLYEFQEVIISDNIIGKLILGTGSKTTNDEGETKNEINKIGKTISSIVSKTFIRPTISSKYDDANISYADIKDGTKLACPFDIGDYSSDTFDATTLLGKLQDSCKDQHTGKEMYVFDYTILFGAISALVMAFIILGFTVDISIRTIKLAVLRLVAPIPIISYIDPGSEKDGAFGNWIKTLTSTYIDLFIRLAIIYFGAYVIVLIKNGLFSETSTGITIFPESSSWIVTSLAGIFIIIGILFFMKQAPKFLKDMLGIKGAPMSNIGLSGMMGGAAALVGGAGLAGAGAAMLGNMSAEGEAAAQGKSIGLGWTQGRDLAAQIRTGDPNQKGGFVNAARDRMMRSAGIRKAAQYGVTASSLEEAKGAMFAAEAEAKRRHHLADRVLQNGWDSLSAREQASIEANWRQRNGVQQGPLSAEQMEDMQNNGAAMYAHEADGAYGKAKSNYEKASKFGDQHRVSTSFEEEYRPSVRENVFHARRPHGADRRGEHQSVRDRVAGTNRWTPNTSNTQGGNTVTDNPDINIGAPGGN